MLTKWNTRGLYTHMCQQYINLSYQKAELESDSIQDSFTNNTLVSDRVMVTSVDIAEKLVCPRVGNCFSFLTYIFYRLIL